MKNKSLIRRSLRASRLMAQTDEPYRHIKLISELILVDMGLPENIGRGMVPKNFQPFLQLNVRQRLFIELRKAFYGELMLALTEPDKPIPVFFPDAWRDWLESKGIKVASFSSNIRRWKVLIQFLIQGARRWFRLCCDSFRPQFDFEESYAIFPSMPEGAIPKSAEEVATHHGVSRWYKESDIRLASEKNIFVNVSTLKNKPIDNCFQIQERIFPGLLGLRKRMTFAVVGIWISLLAVSNVLIGRWWSAILLRDAMELLYFRLIEKEQVASTYLFHDSFFANRPLWTFQAEAQGVRIFLAPYSLNYGGMHIKGFGNTPYPPGWELINWPEYAVWDQEHKNFIQRYDRHNAKYHIVKAYSLTDKSAQIPEISDKSIVLFDVAVYRSSSSIFSGITVHYYRLDVLKEFYNVIYEVAIASGYAIVLKPKGRSIHVTKGYKKFIDEFSRRKGVIRVDSGISAERIVKEVKASISIPFTSTATIAKQASIPSVFYSPLDKLSLDTLYRHDVEILTNKQDLEKWFHSI